MWTPWDIFFFQAEDGIRDVAVTGVQTCALPISLDVYGLTAVTCVVAEIPAKVSRLEPVSVEMVRAQIEVLAKNFPIAAMKTGLLCSTAIISTVAQTILDLQSKTPLVVDPVITAT